jgi:shikimate dehydrogenase
MTARGGRDVPSVRGTTRVYGILGHPVAHSLSPAMQNAAFAALGIDAIYVPFPVRPEGLAATIAGLHAAGVAGLNVTVPHKENAAVLATKLRRRARACAAANTLIRTANGFVGDNTDGDGLVAALRDAGFDPRGKNVLVLGAGGSARSVAQSLAHAGPKELIIANRTPKRAEEVVRSLHRRGTRATDLGVLGDAPTLAELDLIVNCTSASLVGGALPIMQLAIRPGRLLCCDLMYGKPSVFLEQAREAGCRIMDGSGMLLHQGALAFTLWTGKPAPIDVMRAALRQALRRQ